MKRALYLSAAWALDYVSTILQGKSRCDAATWRGMRRISMRQNALARHFICNYNWRDHGVKIGDLYKIRPPVIWAYYESTGENHATQEIPKQSRPPSEYPH